MSEDHFEELAGELLKRSLRAGASDADAVIRETDLFSACVRRKSVERLKKATSNSITLRVFLGTRCATSSTTDFSRSALRGLMRRALVQARATSEDSARGLPAPASLGQHTDDLAIYSPDVEKLTCDEGIALARRAEDAALTADARIVNSEGARILTTFGRKTYVNSLGFEGTYRVSSCRLSMTAIAQDGTCMRRAEGYSMARCLSGLETPEVIGRRAAHRALQKLGARKVSTCHVPIVFDAETAGAFLGHVFEAVRGDSVCRNASLLAEKIGLSVANKSVTILDDGLRAAGLGTRPFDGEGVQSSVTPVIENGVLRHYLLNSYTARKLGLQSTGNAGDDATGMLFVEPTNFYLCSGPYSAKEIIGSVKEGLFVTNVMGLGANLVTGDYSRGVAGMWIKNGEITFPVDGVAIAGNLADMLRGIVMIGSDLEFRDRFAAPTLLIENATVAGT